MNPMNTRLKRALVSILVLLSTAFGAHAATLKVAVASNFYTTLTKLQPNFESKFDHRLKIINASSGVIYAQIQHGAPYDIFLSADSVRPEKLVNSGVALPGSLSTYTAGELVWWQPNLSDNESLTLSHLANFQGRIAIANPKLAPYGVAAMNVLEQLQLQKRVNIVRGNNVGQTFQFVDSGNVPAGLIAKSLILHAKKGGQRSKYDRYLSLPKDWYPPIKQKMVILKRTKHLKAALSFATFMKSALVQKQLASWGYQKL